MFLQKLTFYINGVYILDTIITYRFPSEFGFWSSHTEQLSDVIADDTISHCRYNSVSSHIDCHIVRQGKTERKYTEKYLHIDSLLALNWQKVWSRRFIPGIIKTQAVDNVSCIVDDFVAYNFNIYVHVIKLRRDFFDLTNNVEHKPLPFGNVVQN